MIVLGIDIGNDTTEACLGKKQGGDILFLASSCTETTGVKGTLENIQGIKRAVDIVLEQAKISIEDIDQICLNEPTPVIADLAMSTISETIVSLRGRSFPIRLRQRSWNTSIRCLAFTIAT